MPGKTRDAELLRVNAFFHYLFGPEALSKRGHFLPRWLWLRALGLLFFSDGMLLEAGFISLFFAPRGWRPGLENDHPPSRASLFVLRWE
jgi:hypothetical protein